MVSCRREPPDSTDRARKSYDLKINRLVGNDWLIDDNRTMTSTYLQNLTDTCLTPPAPRFTIYLPHTRCSIQSGSCPTVNPTALLAFPSINPAARRGSVIA